MAIVGEPTEMDIGIVHGGRQKEGINAISKAARFISRMEEKLIPEIERRVHPIAGECTLQIDRRWIPGEKFEDIIKEYQNMLDELHNEDPRFNGDSKIMDISLMEGGYIHEAMETDPGHPLVRAAQKSILGVTGKQPGVGAFQAWTD